MEHLIQLRRQAVLGIARRHRVVGIRWWPSTGLPTCLDLVVEDVPGSLPKFRADLERELGCQVAVYLASQFPSTARDILVEPVAI